MANSAFDADLLVFVDAFGTWTARDYMSSLRAVFGNSPKYADKVRRYSHCVTIEYVGERKIDIAPCILNRNGRYRSEVCNFNTDSFEASAPEAYTDWLIERNKWSGRNHLRKVTRLIKYLRDIKRTFTCPSFLLTTLLGQQVQSADTLHQPGFSDLPTALKTIVNQLDNWLQVRPTRPTVLNPVLPSEVLSDVWDDLKYANFRSKIHTYRTWIDDAYGEQDRDESIGKWRRVFGDDYAKTVAIEQAARVSASARELVLSTADARSQTHLDIVALFKQFGRSVLPTNFFRLPHKQRPPWRKSTSTQFPVRVSATLTQAGTARQLVR